MSLNNTQNRAAKASRLQYLWDEHRIAASLAFQRLMRQPYQTAGAILLMGLSLAMLLFFTISLSKAAVIQNQTVHSSEWILIPSEEGVNNIEVLENQLNSYLDKGLVESVEKKNAQILMQRSTTADNPNDYYINHEVTFSIKTSSVLKSSQEHNVLMNQLQDNILIKNITASQESFNVLHTIVSLAKITIISIGVFLVGFVLLITNYTIKLFMDRYQQEISILYHLGASREFIRRPYLYQGVFLGLAGIGMSLLTTVLMRFSLVKPLSILKGLYGSQIAQITTIDYQRVSIVLGFVLLFSVLSAYISTHKWLTRFQLLRN
ncbi:MAG: FtsX-like permease family protein [Gammaproteobacteria bacterium]|nr:FtsX-like permease family protein [Gammaproteobacteria bacterium]